MRATAKTRWSGSRRRSRGINASGGRSSEWSVVSGQWSGLESEPLDEDLQCRDRVEGGRGAQQVSIKPTGVSTARFGHIDQATGLGLQIEPIGWRGLLDIHPVQVLLSAQIASQFEPAGRGGALAR